MTELLYQTDSYLAAFDGVVMAVDGESQGVILNRTAFYPGGGGQPADQGTLTVNGVSYVITRAKKVGDAVLHMIEDDHPLSAGMYVSGHIGWEYRYRLMRTHTAMHILCGVIWRDYGASVTGGDMEPLLGRMDFEFETMRQELVQEIEEKINAEVAAAREVRTALLPREEAFQIPDLIRTKINLLPKGIDQVRIVEIVGLDLQADGGTHVRNTAEVGRLRVVDYKSKGKINKRIYLEVEA
ncbi:MAG: alanyl-tRNA editing protein [Anaerolineae bacterium]|nr:alanyl-tRNA editing protein [Anaerolineae bacterium]